jgi:hypothetical protein
LPAWVKHEQTSAQVQHHRLLGCSTALTYHASWVPLHTSCNLKRLRRQTS